MKSNKLIAMLAVSGLLALSPTLFAQDTNTPPAGAPASPPPGMRGGRMMGPNLDQLAKDLNLTDDQKAKVKPILDDQRQQMMDLRNDPNFSSLSREDRMAKMKTIRDSTTAKMKDVLTPDQFDQYQKMGPGMRQRRNAAPPADNGTNAPAAPPQA